MVLSWMLNSLEPELADSVLCCTTPHAVWEDLRERFALGNAPRIFQVQRDIYRIEQGQSSIAAYYTKLKGLWDELSSYNTVTCTCGAQNDRSKLMQFLMGLNESYAATRGQILLMNHLPSVRQPYASLVQEEKQRELGSSLLASSSTAAMVVRSNFKSQSQLQGNRGNTQENNFVLMPQSSIALIVIETIILKQLAIKSMVILLVIVYTKALKKLILQGNVMEIPLLTMSTSIIMSMLPQHSKNSKECFLTSLRISTLK